MSTRSRVGALALLAVIVELTLTTAYIHGTLGGPLFTLNAAGYLVLAMAYAAATVPHPIVRRFGWLPRIGLFAFTATTVAAYLAIGPYFTLGWVAKAIELAILTLVAADLVRIYGSMRGLRDAALASMRRTSGTGPMPAA